MYVFIQRSIQSVGSLKGLYTLPTEIPVHSDTNSASLGNILAMQQLRATTNSQVIIYTAEWTEASWRDRKCPNFETVAKGGFESRLSQLWVWHSTTELPVGRMVTCVKLHFIGWPFKSKHHLDTVTGNQYFIYFVCHLLTLPVFMEN